MIIHKQPDTPLATTRKLGTPFLQETRSQYIQLLKGVNLIMTQKRTFLSVKEVAAKLGLPVSSVYDHTQANRFPGIVRIGRRVLIDEQKLDEWIEAGGDKPEAQK